MEQGLFFYVLLFTLPFIGVAVITPQVARFALLKDIVDQPGFHKTHDRAKPLLGGLTIFAFFALVVLIFLPMDEKLVSLVLATVVLVITGLLDDLYDLKPICKIFGQTIAALIVVIGNIDLYRFMVEYFEQFYIPELVVYTLITGWLVLMINAFNLIDGLDGLAAGTAAIIFFAMAVLSVIEGGNPNILGVQLIGAGACLGFLIHNFNPARIFMGDTGSMLLGFILATTHLFTIKYPFSAQLVLGSMFILAYPALDIGYAIYRRIYNRTPIFQADQGHIHHVLLSLGYSVRLTVLMIYGLNIFFGVIAVALLSIDLPTPVLLLLWLATIAFVILLFRKLIAISNKNGLSYSKR